MSRHADCARCYAGLVNQISRRQHFLPRFLLKGFASRSRGGSYFTYLFQKGRAPHETNTINVAVVGDFYGREADGGGVEAGLGESERLHATVLDRVRKEGLVDEDRLVLGEFIRLLLVRTRHMRDSATDWAAQMSRIVGRLLQTPQAQENLKREIGERALRDERFWTSVSTPGLSLSKQQMEYLVDLAMAQSNLPSILQQYSEALPMMDVQGAVTAGQIGGLRRAIAERPVPPDDVVWSVMKTEPHVLILGDLAVIARTGNGYCHPMQPDAGLQAMLIPISHQHLLVGALEPKMGVVDPEEVNLASAQLSRDFFLASRNTERERRYQAQLGARAQFAGLSEMLTQIATESFRDELGRGSEAPPSPTAPPLPQ
jgi:Protein of unknown function (DUF4238)